MAVDITPRSRRAILAAGLGGLAATVAGAIGRNPPSTRAATGDPVLAGVANTATTTTSLDQTTAGAGGLAVTSPRTAITGVGGSAIIPSATKTGVAGYDSEDATARGVYGNSGPGTGVQGESTSGKGVYGKSTSSTGVRGQSDSGIGMWGTSLTNRAVFGTTGSGTLPAIGGQNTAGWVGVHGYGGTGTPPPPHQETGVEGVCNISNGSNGVLGVSSAGAGVWGKSVDGIGVIGTSDNPTGTGVYGFGAVGVSAEAPSGGYALNVAGPAFFTTSGKVTIASGSSKAVGVIDGLRAESLVFATLQTNRSGIWVRAVTKNQAAGTITIYLNAAVPGSTTIAWFVVN